MADGSDSAHELFSANASLFILLVLMCLGIAALIRRYRVKYLPESGACLIVGFFLGLCVSYSSAEERAAVFFSPDVVFFALLPPIILDAGYTLKRKDFFGNLGTISLLALVGTIANNLVFGGLMYGFARAGWVPLESAAECLLFGAVISATDPVATLAVMGSKEVNAHPLLYTLVFGESVLNDAIAMTLYRTFRAAMPAPSSQPIDLSGSSQGVGGAGGVSVPPDVVAVVYGLSSVAVPAASSFGAGDVVAALFVSAAVAVASVAVGLVVGLGCCALFRWMQLAHAPVYEFLLVALFAFFSYVAADFVHLSGVMSLFFCAIVLAHYNFHNLVSARSKPRTNETMRWRNALRSRLMLDRSLCFLLWSNFPLLSEYRRSTRDLAWFQGFRSRVRHVRVRVHRGDGWVVYAGQLDVEPEPHRADRGPVPGCAGPPRVPFVVPGQQLRKRTRHACADADAGFFVVGGAEGPGVLHAVRVLPGLQRALRGVCDAGARAVLHPGRRRPHRADAEGDGDAREAGQKCGQGPPGRHPGGRHRLGEGSHTHAPLARQSAWNSPTTSDASGPATTTTSR